MVCKYFNECDKTVTILEVRGKCMAEPEKAMYEQECCHNFVMSQTCGCCGRKA
jgi:hypothetical protein